MKTSGSGPHNPLYHVLQHIAFSSSLYVSPLFLLTFFHNPIVCLSHAFMDGDIKHLFNSFHHNAKYPLKIHHFTPEIHSTLLSETAELATCTCVWLCISDYCLCLYIITMPLLKWQFSLCMSVYMSAAAYKHKMITCFFNFPVITFTP